MIPSAAAADRPVRRELPGIRPALTAAWSHQHGTKVHPAVRGPWLDGAELKMEAQAALDEAAAAAGAARRSDGMSAPRETEVPRERPL